MFCNEADLPKPRRGRIVEPQSLMREPKRLGDEPLNFMHKLFRLIVEAKSSMHEAASFIVKEKSSMREPLWLNDEPKRFMHEASRLVVKENRLTQEVPRLIVDQSSLERFACGPKGALGRPWNVGGVAAMRRRRAPAGRRRCNAFAAKLRGCADQSVCRVCLPQACAGAMQSTKSTARMEMRNTQLRIGISRLCFMAGLSMMGASIGSA